MVVTPQSIMCLVPLLLAALADRASWEGEIMQEVGILPFSSLQFYFYIDFRQILYFSSLYWRSDYNIKA
jgi:hypothetical protein